MEGDPFSRLRLAHADAAQGWRQLSEATRRIRATQKTQPNTGGGSMKGKRTDLVH
jgi:hypothetical protein